ncbi:MAG: PQQ-binding-like beta-propeller repeat protein [Sedimentitalea sp.]
MIAEFRFFRTAPVLLALGLLSACAEPEIILPGEREDLRPEVSRLAPASDGNSSRAIRLPGQTRNAAWAQPFGTPGYRTAHPALSSAPQLLWSTNIGEGDGKRVRITADPVVGGGLIYTLDSGALVSGVSPSGAVVWNRDLTPSEDNAGEATGGGITYDAGTLYVSSGFGIVAALDASSGALKWEQRLDATGSGTPLVRDGLLYLVAGDDTGWAINTKDGRIVWQVQGTPSIANVLGAPAPVLTRDLVIFAFGSGDLIAAFRRGGLRRWTASVAGQRSGRAAARISDVTGSPVLVGDTIYAGNHSGRTVAFSIDSGERKWTAREGALGPVWPVGGSLFAVTDLSQLVRLDARDGAVIWASDLPGFVRQKPRKRGAVFAHYGPIVAGGRVIVASNDGLLRFFAPEDGSQSASVSVPGGATTAPVVAGGVLYVVSASGQLHAFR